jgi:hypothetical protein
MPDINAVPEIRHLTELHSVHVLNGRVTWSDLLNACRAGQRDVIHFATHGDSQRLQLSDVVLTPEQVAQAARLTNAHLIFFNSCESGRHAAFAVRNGVQYAIHTTEKVLDALAWQMPLAFYQYLARQLIETEEADIPAAFLRADSGDGIYGFYQLIVAESSTKAMMSEMKALQLTMTQRARYIRWIWYAIISLWVMFLIHVWTLM